MDKRERVARAIAETDPMYADWGLRQLDWKMADAAIAALEPVTVQEAARVLLGQWLSGSFEDTADAIADDAIISQWAHVDRTYPDANPIIESWLRALAQKDAE